MNLHEYQGKELLKKFGIPVQEGFLATTPEEAIKAYDQVVESSKSPVAVIKAQIHAGGRGKGGGVKLVKSREQAAQTAPQILGMMLKTPQTPGGMNGPGKLVRKILVTEDSFKPDFESCKEYYVSILTDREKKANVIIYSTEGGMDIEAVAEKTPHLVHKEYVHPLAGFQAFQARNIAFKLGLSGESFKNMVRFVTNLYKAFTESDATLFEINPCLKDGYGNILAVDCKVSLDDNALFRHSDLEAMRDTDEEDPAEVEAKAYNLNYVSLDGNVGCMVNGAGLAMATMDLIQLSGGKPANFLDVGGGASPKTVEAGFRIILKDPHVRAILVNIFGGIVRCDRVAAGIIEAYKSIGDIKVPVIVRLQGTNAEEARALIDSSGLKVIAASTFTDAAERVRAALS